MMRTTMALLTLAWALCVLAQNAAAGPSGALVLQTVVEKVRKVEDGQGQTRTELVPMDIAVSGDEVVYTVRYTNVGDRPAEHVLITNPIPPDVRYEADSAFGPGTKIVYSADGGVSYAAPENLMVSNGDGTERHASPDEYTHIRWLLGAPIDPGAQGFARFRAVVR